MTDTRRTEALLATGQTLLHERRFEEAIQFFGDFLARDPESFPARTGLALALEASGRPADALVHILGAARAAPRDVHTKRRFLRILGAAGPAHFQPEVLGELLQAIRIPTLVEQASELARIPLGRKYGGFEPDQFRERDLAALICKDLRDPLFLEFLARGRNTNLQLEQLLTRLRRELLLEIRVLPPAAPVETFAHCLAHHCFNNGYVFPVSAEENVRLEELDAEIDRAVRTGVSRNLEWLLALYACYRPLLEASTSERIRALPPGTFRAALRGLVKRTLFDPREEERSKPDLPRFGQIADEVSLRVRAQYEEFPYPQWVHIGVVDDYPTRLRLINEEIDWPAALATAEVLVAGCGTGRHPITVAANNPGAKVTAVDLSSTSLAYGWRMARELGLGNLEFHLGDLLQITLLARRFHIIECVGVLHHLDDPLEGLGALLDVLHRGGLLRIGLYSETARRPITRAREQTARLGLTGSAEDVRALRQKIASGAYPELEDVTRFEDYFGLPSCRDLLFHAHEVQFDFPRIRALLEHHGLEFLGMDCTREIEAEARRLDVLPPTASPGTLEYWEAAEATQPWLFGSMYVFWCGRKGEIQRRR